MGKLALFGGGGPVAHSVADALRAEGQSYRVVGQGQTHADGRPHRHAARVRLRAGCRPRRHRAQSGAACIREEKGVKQTVAALRTKALSDN
jgi:hypothetical protein